MIDIRTKTRMLLIAAVAALLYWSTESVLMTFVFDEHPSVIENFLHPGDHELWMRSFSTVGLFALVLMGQYLLVSRQRTIIAISELLANINTLSGLLPICGWCKKMRNDAGYWKSVEQYISEHTGASFTHSMCPECETKFNAELERKDGFPVG